MKVVIRPNERTKHPGGQFVPETHAAVSCINEWIDQQPELVSGTEAARGVGMPTLEVRGITVNAFAQPYRFYLLQRVQNEYEALDDNARSDVDTMLTACDMKAIVDIRLSRNIG